MHVPLTDLISVSNYINAAVPSLTSKVEMSFVNLAEAASFTIPYNMYEDGGWKFNTRRMEAALRKEPAIPIQK